MVIAPEKLPDMSADELREVVQSLFKTLTFKQATIDKLTHENAVLKRLKFAAQSERYSAEQRSLLDETLDADLQAVNDEIEQLQSDDATQAKAKQQPKRQVLPANLPRTDIHHEPDSTTCAGACAIAAIVIRHATARATIIVAPVGATRQVVFLVPIASIAKRIDPPNGVGTRRRSLVVLDGS